MNNYTKLLHSGKTVFTKKDIQNILVFGTQGALDKFVYRTKKEGFFINPFYGIYVLKDYSIFELACKIKKKSYISLETVLRQEGLVFQYYKNIFLVSDDTLEKTVGTQSFSCNKIKDDILLNPLGLIHKKNYTIASAERAVCDRIYLSGDYYFDDVSMLHFETLEKISQMYNKRTIRLVKKLITQYA